jgi:hypothetical protein
MKSKLRSLRAALGSALWLFVTAAAAGEPGLWSLPESAAARAGRAFVDAYNREDVAALRGYLSAHLSEQALREEGLNARVDTLRGLRRELGPLEIVEASGVERVLVLNALGAGGDADIVVIGNADDPARLDGLMVIRSDNATLAGAAP